VDSSITWTKYLDIDGANARVNFPNGKVGIGTGSPSAKLEVVGNVSVNDSISIIHPNGSLYQPVYGTDDDLVLYLPFSEDSVDTSTQFDRSPYGNDATLNGVICNSTSANQSTSRYGGACYFDGVDDNAEAISITDPGTFALDLDGSMTLSGWFKFNTVATAGLITKRNSGGNQVNYMLRYTTQINFVIRNKAGTNQEFNVAWSPVAGRWYYVVATYNEFTKDVGVYVDGERISTSTAVGSPQTDDNPVRIGNDDGTSGYFDGSADEIMIYKRALTAEEIRTHYLRGSGFGASGAITADKFRVVNTSGSRTLELNQTSFEIYNRSGSDVFVVDRTTGMVGIGTASPTERLGVVGNVSITGTLTAGGVANAGGDIFMGSTYRAVYFDSDGNSGIYANSDDSLKFAIGGVAEATLTAGGLDMGGNSITNNLLLQGPDDGNMLIVSKQDTANALMIYTPSSGVDTERLRIGNAATATATWSDITHTGMVMSGNIAMGANNIYDAGIIDLNELRSASGQLTISGIASADSPILIRNANTAQDNYVTRLTLSSGDTATATWNAITHTGMVMGGEVNFGGYNLANAANLIGKDGADLGIYSHTTGSEERHIIFYTSTGATHSARLDISAGATATATWSNTNVVFDDWIYLTDDNGEGIRHQSTSNYFGIFTDRTDDTTDGIIFFSKNAAGADTARLKIGTGADTVAATWAGIEHTNMAMSSGAYVTSGTGAANTLFTIQQTTVVGWRIGMTSGNSALKFDTGGDTFPNPELEITSAGDISGTHGSYHTSSDERLKKDIVTIPNALDKVLALRGVNFKWKNESKGTNLRMGLISQEVESVIPEVVHTQTDEMETKAVEYQYLAGLFVEAIKEQQEQIEELSTRIEELES